MHTHFCIGSPKLDFVNAEDDGLGNSFCSRGNTVLLHECFLLVRLACLREMSLHAHGPDSMRPDGSNWRYKHWLCAHRCIFYSLGMKGLSARNQRLSPLLVRLHRRSTTKRVRSVSGAQFNTSVMIATFISNKWGFERLTTIFWHQIWRSGLGLVRIFDDLVIIGANLAQSSRDRNEGHDHINQETLGSVPLIKWNRWYQFEHKAAF